MRTCILLNEEKEERYNFVYWKSFVYPKVDQLAICHSAPLRYLVPLPRVMDMFNGIPMELFRLIQKIM